MEIVSTPYAQLVLGIAGVLILTVLGVYVVRRFRDGIEEKETTSVVLAKFRESHHQGVLTEAEFRTIKTILADRKQAELNREDESS